MSIQEKMKLTGNHSLNGNKTHWKFNRFRGKSSSSDIPLWHKGSYNSLKLHPV